MTTHDIPKDAKSALMVLKAIAHYEQEVGEQENTPAFRPALQIPVSSHHTVFFGVSGKGKSLMPKFLLAEAKELAPRYEPYTSQISEAIDADPSVTIASADMGWLARILEASEINAS